MKAKIEISREEIAAFCRRNGIKRLALFGSVFRDDFTPESDVDVIVEFEQGKTPGLEFIDIQDELSEIYRRKVDLHTFGGSRATRIGCFGTKYSTQRRRSMSRRDDRVSLVDLLIYAKDL